MTIDEAITAVRTAAPTTASTTGAAWSTRVAATRLSGLMEALTGDIHKSQRELAHAV